MTTELYFVQQDGCLDPETVPALLCRLSPEQREAHHRMRPGGTRDASLQAQLLVRLLALRHLQVPNHLLNIESGLRGKPYLKSFSTFHFNISHTKGAFAVAVSRWPVGVDVERLRPAPLRVARRFFSPQENAYLQDADAQLQDRRFFEVWTRKEALLKHSGKGLSVRLSSVNTLSEENTPFLSTVLQNNYMISLCCQSQERPLPSLLSDASLLQTFQKLTPYPD